MIVGVFQKNTRGGVSKNYPWGCFKTLPVGVFQKMTRGGVSENDPWGCLSTNNNLQCMSAVWFETPLENEMQPHACSHTREPEPAGQPTVTRALATHRPSLRVSLAAPCPATRSALRPAPRSRACTLLRHRWPTVDGVPGRQLGDAGARR